MSVFIGILTMLRILIQKLYKTVKTLLFEREYGTIFKIFDFKTDVKSSDTILSKNLLCLSTRSLVTSHFGEACQSSLVDPNRVSQHA